MWLYGTMNYGRIEALFCLFFTQFVCTKKDEAIKGGV